MTLMPYYQCINNALVIQHHQHHHHLVEQVCREIQDEECVTEQVDQIIITPIIINHALHIKYQLNRKNIMKIGFIIFSQVEQCNTVNDLQCEAIQDEECEDVSVIMMINTMMMNTTMMNTMMRSLCTW